MLIVPLALFATEPASGYFNTAHGLKALQNNTSGYQNTVFGSGALLNNTIGINNTAVGFNALERNGGGWSNTAVGDFALQHAHGDGNVGIGNSAGYQVIGHHNIEIYNPGTPADNGVIRIGIDGIHIAFFAAGVRGVIPNNANGVPVLVDTDGQLGTSNSSRRFKEDISDMGGVSSGLLRLRPLTFRYKKAYADGSKPLDYGLIDEEVAEVYPDLVVKGADGQIETVQYQKLTPMLLNEVRSKSNTPPNRMKQ